MNNLLRNPCLSYLSLILLQLKLVWRIWDFKDLVTGDTASYFAEANNWFMHLRGTITFSPLYNALLGSLLNITSDVYSVIILHRIIIVFTVTIMMLALLRKLLPHWLAWLVAAWWSILPINFDTLYEVHLFSFIPILSATLLVLYKPGVWARGGAIAILIASNFLVRNEYAISTILFAATCFLWEVWSYRNSPRNRSLQRILLAYLLPCLPALLLIGFFIQHAYPSINDPIFPEIVRQKHTLNICQIYAFGYQQRHPEWINSPWLECQSLMKTTFGQPLPTFLEAFQANPQAILDHLSWNISLALNGLQVALFNATSGSVNPDYATVQLNMQWVIIPTILLLAIFSMGATIFYSERKYWWNFWLKTRIWGWIVLSSTASVSAFVVLPMQRPRPSYLFSLSALLMALAGMSIFVIFKRFKLLDLGGKIVPFIAVLMICFIPNYYTEQLTSGSRRPALDYVNSLKPFKPILDTPETVFLGRIGGGTTLAYLQVVDITRTLDYNDSRFFDGVPEKKSLTDLLDEKNVNLFLVDHNLIYEFSKNPHTLKFISHPEANGWKLIAQQDIPESRWMLFQKNKSVK